jgi:hypothetical protein
VLTAFGPALRRAIGQYFEVEPAGSHVTLAALDEVGQPAAQAYARERRTTLDRVKQDIGLAVPILLTRLAGSANVATYRDVRTNRPSTRTRTDSWPRLTWVSRYTPHRVNAEGRRRIREALANGE